MVKRYHASFPSLSYGFDSRYPLQPSIRFISYITGYYAAIVA